MGAVEADSPGVKGTPRKPDHGMDDGQAAPQIALSDLMHAVPRLLQVLPSDSLASLAATNAAMRNLVHAFASVLEVSNEEGKIMLTAVSWPLVIKRRLDKRTHGWIGDPARLWLQTRHLNATTLSRILKKMPANYAGRHSSGVICMKPKAIARTLSQARVHLVAAGLTTATLQNLCLYSGHTLRHLNLSHNRLDAEAVSVLTSQHWPKLHQLNLSYNGLSAEAVGRLQYSKWPLLHTLELAGNNICAESLAELRKAKWLRLSWLDISSSSGHLGGKAMAQLAKASWGGSLATLKGSIGVPDAVSMAQLSKGNWTYIEVLQLDTVKSDLTAVSYLVAGQLPKLKSLVLKSCSLSLPALRRLKDGKWPFLHSLEIAVNLRDKGMVSWLIHKPWRKQVCSNHPPGKEPWLFFKPERFHGPPSKQFQHAWPQLCAMRICHRAKPMVNEPRAFRQRALLQFYCRVLVTWLACVAPKHRQSLGTSPTESLRCNGYEQEDLSKAQREFCISEDEMGHFVDDLTVPIEI